MAGPLRKAGYTNAIGLASGTAFASMESAKFLEDLSAVHVGLGTPGIYAGGTVADEQAA